MEDGNGYDSSMEMEGGNGYNGEPTESCLSGFVDNGSRDSLRYYLSRRTVLEMLKDRGYAVALSEINLSVQDFRAIYGQDPDVDRLRISISHQSDPSKRVKKTFLTLHFAFLCFDCRVLIWSKILDDTRTLS